MPATYKILIMGASYGSLLGAKLLAAGNTVKLICLPAEADLINEEGALIRMPVKGRSALVEIDTRKLPGKLSAGGTQGVNPKDYDLVRLRCRNRSTVRPACASCSTPSPRRKSPACPS